MTTRYQCVTLSAVTLNREEHTMDQASLILALLIISMLALIGLVALLIWLKREIRLYKQNLTDEMSMLAVKSGDDYWHVDFTKT